VAGVFGKRWFELFNISEKLNLRLDFTHFNIIFIIVVLILVVKDALVDLKSLNLLQIWNITLEDHVRN
jgi:hypothetical protein